MPESIVRVLSEGEFIECVRRRLASLPDGRDAVLYAGILFPIRQPGSYIEVSGDRHIVEDVSPLESGAPVNHTIRLYMDDSGSSARLMVDGDAVVRDYVAAVLDEASVVAKAEPTTSTPASDGRRYDWCFEFEKGHLAAELKQHFGLCVEAPPHKHGTAGLTSANIEFGEDGLPHLREVSAESDVCRLITTRLRTLLSVNIARRGHAQHSLSTIDVAKWRQKAVNGPRLAEELFEELSKADQIIKRIHQDKAALIEERDLLQMRVAKKISFSSVLNEVFPEIDFIRNSKSVIDTTFTSVKSLGAMLRDIVNVKPEVSRNVIRGARTEWYELHVSTGQRGDGRIYFHRVSPSRIQVLVSLKEHQKADTAWIRGLSA